MSSKQISTTDTAMELLYIWINSDESGFIQQQGFNFSPNYRFQMAGNEIDGYRLTCTMDAAYPNIWNTKNIVNLTAVVGKNGTGKTTLLRHLANASILPIPEKDEPYDTPDYFPEIARHGHRSGWPDDSYDYAKMVQVYRKNNTILVLHNFDKHTFDNQTDFETIHISPNDYRSAKDLLQNLTTICITNAFSSSKSIWESVWNQTPIIFSPIGNYKRSDAFFRKICCLDYNDNLHDGNPEKSDALHAFQYLQGIIASHKGYKDFERLATISYYSRSDSVNGSNSSMISDNKDIVVSLANFYNLTAPPTRKPNSGSENRYWYSLSYIRKAFRSEQYISCCLQSICSVLLCYFHNERHYLERAANSPEQNKILAEYYFNAEDEISQLFDILSDCPPVTDDIVSRKYQFALPRVRIERGSNAYEKFCKFIDQLMKKDYSFILKYLIVDLAPQSSGEQALQNIYSWLRLPPVFNEILGENTVVIRDNILLLLDEVDLYMHPEWQRGFLFELSNRLQAEYPNKHIQLIISTHSPLVLSDIPLRNTIYLEKTGETCTLAQKTSPQESFGANLFSLLKDSFFLEKSLGEFAHHTICRVIEDLEILKELDAQKKQFQKIDLPFSNARKQYAALRRKLLQSDDPLVEAEFRKKCKNYRRIIDLIGEPMICGKLREMYEDLFPEEDLNKRNLDKLRQLLESGDPNERKRYQKLLSDMLSADDSD